LHLLLLLTLCGCHSVRRPRHGRLRPGCHTLVLIFTWRRLRNRVGDDIGEPGVERAIWATGIKRWIWARSGRLRGKCLPSGVVWLRIRHDVGRWMLGWFRRRGGRGAAVRCLLLLLRICALQSQNKLFLRLLLQFLLLILKPRLLLCQLIGPAGGFRLRWLATRRRLHIIRRLHTIHAGISQCTYAGHHSESSRMLPLRISNILHLMKRTQWPKLLWTIFQHL
jgi:hypothetical protein